MTLEGDLHQPIDQLRQRNARFFPQFGIHRNRRETGQGVDFVEVDARIVHQEIHPRKARAADGGKSAHRDFADPVALRSRHLRVQDQLGAVFEVFVGVVVKLLARHDFTNTRSLDLAVTEHRTFELTAGNTLLHQGKVVKSEGLAQSRHQFLVPLHFGDADTRAAGTRFDEDGQRQSAKAFEQARFVFEIGTVDQLPVDHRHPDRLQYPFTRRFVESHRAAEHPGAHIRQIGHLTKPLQGAIFPPGAMHDGENAVDPGLDQDSQGGQGPFAARGEPVHLAGQRLFGEFPRHPATILRDAQRHHVVTCGRKTLGHRPGRHQRHLVLHTPTAKNHTDAARHLDSS